MAFIFESDEKKSRLNWARHKVSFEEASTVFGDPFSRTIDDPLHSEDEDRYVIIGQSVRRRLLVVVHTIRGDNIRIISARIATATERTRHEEDE
jgi:uncharacterized DUF497 family protein